MISLKKHGNYKSTHYLDVFIKVVKKKNGEQYLTVKKDNIILHEYVGNDIKNELEILEAVL